MGIEQRRHGLRLEEEHDMEELLGSGEEWIEGPGVGSMLITREVFGRRGGSGRIPMEMVSGWRRRNGKGWIGQVGARVRLFK